MIADRLLLGPGALPFTLILGKGGTICDSVSMTKDIAGLSLSPAFVEPAVAAGVPWPWRGAGMTRLKIGD